MSTKTQSLREKVLSRGEIEQLIADGHQIVIFDRKVLKVDAWLQYHPGGDKAILHMVGKDATDEITMYSKHTPFVLFHPVHWSSL